MAAKRFGGYVTEREGIELDMMRVELNLSQTGAQAKKDSELLTVMRLATKKLMNDIRAKRKASGGEDALSDVVTWEDVADEIGVDREAMKRLIEKDPRESAKKTDGKKEAKKDEISEEPGEEAGHES